MGAIERNGFVFEPEFSVVNQDGAIHVYKNGQFIEEIQFDFTGEFPDHNQIEELVNHYCSHVGKSRR
ncbi:YbxH family protein [Heyndrickxia vini]|uniref:YbxH family protein n=1 Tax=Heyndrickxia vini TaxID=1476025 RepID=A0ABX7E7K2_9BACI|nr:YbxH family protein [Heyndrickxia vini]QQZ11204.1 YbxH family protein [Heyndrickxia vini]